VVFPSFFKKDGTGASRVRVDVEKVESRVVPKAIGDSRAVKDRGFSIAWKAMVRALRASVSQGIRNRH